MLWSHKHVTIAHDAQLEWKAKRGIAFISVDEIDNVPPCFADNRQVRLRGVMRERLEWDLEFHVEDGRVLDLWWTRSQHRLENRDVRPVKDELVSMLVMEPHSVLDTRHFHFNST